MQFLSDLCYPCSVNNNWFMFGPRRLSLLSLDNPLIISQQLVPGLVVCNAFDLIEVACHASCQLLINLVWH